MCRRRNGRSGREGTVMVTPLHIKKLETHQPPVLQFNGLLQVGLLLQLPPPQYVLIIVEHPCPLLKFELKILLVCLVILEQLFYSK